MQWNAAKEYNTLRVSLLKSYTAGSDGLKFAHISDTHLGFSQFGTGERAKDVYNAFLQAIDISIKEKVEFVVFAGDIFHTPTPDGTAIINMAHALKKLQDVQIPAYFILSSYYTLPLCPIVHL